MQKLYFLFLFFSTTLLFSQSDIPSDYYSSANGLTGYELKTALRNIIANGHQTRSYDQLYEGDGINGSQGYIDTHSDVSVTSGNNYENDGSILDYYSENPADDDGNPLTATANNDPYNYTHGNNQCGNQSAEGDCYNREHLVPQSSFNSASPMQTDIHHVIPTDGRVNNFRGSLPFGNVATANWTSLNGSKRGSSAVVGYSGTMFEPIDEFKGDIARALLYFATRYENTVDGYTSFDMFNGTEDQVFQTWAIELLLDWHNNVDPVDQRERERNEATWDFQGNANPFVDHPEYANMIWNPTPDTTNPSNPSNLVASNPTDNSIDLSWTASTDNVSVTSYDIYLDNVNTYNSTTTTYTASGLSPETNYCFKIVAKDAAGNTSGFSNETCEMTTNNGSSGEVDLFISEYVESGNNKAIEIANFTGNSVSLAQYTIARNVNSGASWGASLQLIGSVANQDVHVITKGNAETALTSLADQLSSADAMLFNGDDPVGLFKNGTLIDVFGTFGGSNNYEDIVYRRKSSVDAPSTTFNLIGEWDAFPQGTYTDLGSHSQTLNSTNFNINTIKLYPNPVLGNIITINSKNTYSFSIYNVLGKNILKGFSKNGIIDISVLKQGVYIVKLISGNQSTTKKLIKQ